MKQVHVVGDHILITHMFRVPNQYYANGGPWPETVVRTLLGGARHLQELVSAICTGTRETNLVAPIGSSETPDGHVLTLWAPFQKSQGESKQVWRVEQSFLASVEDLHEGDYSFKLVPTSGAAEGEYPRAVPDANFGQIDATPLQDSILLIDDASLDFRNNASRWPTSIKHDDTYGEIVLKTRGELAKGPLWETLIARHRDRLTVVLPVSALRRRGAQIRQGLSWDRAIEDLSRELHLGQSSNDIARVNRLIVSFQGAGAAAFQRDDSGQLLLRQLVFVPTEVEGSWERMHPGRVFGATSILTAGVTRHLADPLSMDLATAITCSLATVRDTHERGAADVFGFGIDSIQGSIDSERTFDSIRVNFPKPSQPNRRNGLNHSLDTLPLHQRNFLSVASKGLTRKNIPGSEYHELTSSMLEDAIGRGEDFASVLGMQVVIRGVDYALHRVPRAVYNQFLTVDRDEIEKTNEIRQLILNYASNASDRKPLSIAVFGPPGSGKSFAVSQIAITIFGHKHPVHTFNLSQFRSETDLRPAFDLIRDASVKGEIPMVFWDEFDTKGLEWLKSFLGPMQDAEFFIDGMSHPFGKAIFVFAGGTSHTFDAFDRSRHEDKTTRDAFNLSKGPDFVSRLRGYIDIKGINLRESKLGEPIEGLSAKGQSEERANLADASTRIIRRAILLRSSIERLLPQLVEMSTQLASVDPAVVRAFLNVSEFNHGARSVEQIVGMSNLSNANTFSTIHLPSQDLLKGHVSDDFAHALAAANQNERLVDMVAQQFQEDGLLFEPGHPSESIDPFKAVPFSNLNASEKERRRHSARLALAALAEGGYRQRHQTQMNEVGSEDFGKMLHILERNIAAFLSLSTPSLKPDQSIHLARTMAEAVGRCATVQGIQFKRDEQTPSVAGG